MAVSMFIPARAAAALMGKAFSIRSKNLGAHCSKRLGLPPGIVGGKGWVNSRLRKQTGNGLENTREQLAPF
jgi:hypothetical protein